MLNRKAAFGYPSAEIQSKLLNAIHELICAFDIDGRFIYINDASYTLLGYKPEELIGLSCFDFVIDEDRQRSVQANIEGYNGANIPVFENRFRHKDGRIITLFWEGGWDNGDNLLYALGRDVTEQRRLEQLQKQQHDELFATQQKLKQLLDRITDGFIGLDENLKITFWNKAAEMISGLPAEQLIGQLLWDVLPEPTLSVAKEFYKLANKGKRPFQKEYYSKRISRWIAVSSYPSNSGLSIFFQDVTERRNLQEQLMQKEEMQHKKELQVL
jgi:PAS domain S-box-containing protein